MIEYPIVSVSSDDFDDPFASDGGNGPHPGSLHTGTFAGDPAFEIPRARSR